MITYVHDTDFAADASGEKLRELVRATRAKPNGELKELSAQVAEFESVFGFSTETMLTRLKNGSLAETDVVARWVLIAKRRDNAGRSA